MQIDHLAVEILKKVATEPGMTIKMLCARIGLPQRHFYYRRAKINDWLDAAGLSSLICDAKSGVRLAENEAKDVLLKVGLIPVQHYKLTAEERRDTLLLHLACHAKPAFTHHLSKLSGVSRNTTLDDLHLLNKYLKPHQLTLTFNKKQGYSIEGCCLARRLMVRQILQHALKYADNQTENRIAQMILQQLNTIGIDQSTVKQVVDRRLLQSEQQLQRTFTDKDRRVLHYMVVFSLLDTLKGHYPQFTAAQMPFLHQRAECEVAADLNASLARDLGLPEVSGNTLFFSLLFSSSKKATPMASGDGEDCRLSAAVKQLIAKFQALSGVYLQDTEQLELQLFSHLGPAIYRCLFGMCSENTSKKEIFQRYPLIFRLCQQIIASMEEEYQVVFCDDELSYIVISFAAWLDRRSDTAEQHILLVTEGGPSSTAILENQLRHLTVLPLHIERVSASQLQRQGVGSHVGLVVSTIGLSGQIPAHVGFIHTRHILSDEDKQRLRLMLEHSIEASEISELLDTLVASACSQAPQAKEPLREAFNTIIHHFIHKQRRRSLSCSPPGQSLLTHVNYTSRQSGWRAQIRKATQPLVDAGTVDRDYARNIIRQIEHRGITTYLTPDILLLHDAPPEMATQAALSLLKLKHPLHFDLPDVTLMPTILVILVPSANLSHIPLLEALNTLISDDATLARLRHAASLQDVQRCISEMGAT